jgi:glycine cleavage system transcriptional repressor
MTSDKSYLVISAVGPDRAGIVSELSALIHGAGANLEDSRMAVLGGEFALLLLVSGNEGVLAKLAERLRDAETTLGLRLLMKSTSGPRAGRDVLPYVMRVSGFDHPGIVQAITSVLARRGVNLRSLESRLNFAPESGTPLFALEAELEVPSATVLSELRRELTAKCEQENLDFTLDVGA